ncbi:hypothetical protein N7463_000044 [Penicillium fimorum]|uniref:Uncharacterized protein n=1 Tax=Penicillium fimorum TaxID=1882269 RepID=A0A9W9Y3S4_9EURO|nr:hypothetical protein N7463_000044 [Penicillium fimorum]
MDSRAIAWKIGIMADKAAYGIFMFQLLVTAIQPRPGALQELQAELAVKTPEYGNPFEVIGPTTMKNITPNNGPDQQARQT